MVPVVGVFGSGTSTLPVMNECRPQWNVYVPYASNVQLPVHPGGLALGGMSWHEVGCAVSKTTLCEDAPVG